jgi:hypothetical protein
MGTAGVTCPGFAQPATTPCQEEQWVMPDKTFEQYQLLVEDSARLSDRRQTVNNLYLSANSLLLSAIAILAQQSGVKSLQDVLLVLLLVCAGIFLSSDWGRLLRQYRQLLNLRFALLKKIESQEDFPGPIKTYQEEELLYPADPRKSRFGFARVESNLPRVFIVLYILVVIGALVLQHFSH